MRHTALGADLSRGIRASHRAIDPGITHIDTPLHQ